MMYYTLKDAQYRLRQTTTPEHIVRFERHDPMCLGHSADPKIPALTCRCGGAKVHGYGYAVVLGKR